MIRQFANIMAFSATLFVNALSNTLPLNGQTAADIANRFENFFLPANYVFSIWGLIYTGLLAFIVYQALPSQRENPRLRSVGYWFVVSCAANCVWLFLFHYDQFALSTVAMAVLLFSLIVIYRRLRDGSPQVSTAEKVVARGTFSLYMGWITVATVANVAFVLKAAQWDGFGLSEQTWGVIILIVAGLIAGAFAYLNRDIVYAGVIVWAFVGIIVRWPEVGPVVMAAAIMAAVVAIVALLAYFITGGGRGNTLQRQGA
jgi:hypothetical protein